MAVKENLNGNMEDVFDGEDFTTTENGGEKMTMKNINWKLYAKCALGVVIVGAASVALYKWRKSKKTSATAVVVSTPSSDNSGASEVAPAATVVEI
nr:MAG TPA: ATPase [Caudoviricetes sp.]